MNIENFTITELIILLKPELFLKLSTQDKAKKRTPKGNIIQLLRQVCVIK
jgi:hypothetical protein